MSLIEIILSLSLAIAGGLVIALKWKVAALLLATVVTLLLEVAVGLFKGTSLLGIGAWCIALVAMLQLGYLVGLWFRYSRYDQ